MTFETGKRPQSLHLYFVRGGRYGRDVVMQVERIRDGGSFDTRRVTSQRGAVILEMIASFHRVEPGADRHAAPPSSIGFDESILKQPDIEYGGLFVIRTRPDDTSVFAVPPFWIRARDAIEDDPLIQACTRRGRSRGSVARHILRAAPLHAQIRDAVGQAYSLFQHSRIRICRGGYNRSLSAADSRAPSALPAAIAMAAFIT